MRDRELMRLVATGQAASRADLARLSGLAPSSVSLRVEELLAAGLLREAGAGASRGGRRPRRLELGRESGLLLAADLGSHHARLAVLDLAGEPLEVVEEPWEIAAGPVATLDWIAGRLDALADRGQPVRGVGVGLPGPVDFAGGRVVTPSRMPGWNEFGVRDHLAARYDVPLLIENDVNLMAVGEHRRAWPESDNLMVVKAGTGIGCGVIASGRLHRGRGAAGDISHVRVRSDASAICACGQPDCLEAYASGAALVDALSGQGIAVDHASQIVRLVDDGVPQATNLVRGAGRLMGEVLTVLVNFFNPDALVIGGSLSAAEPLIAAIRAAVYERCLPLATRHLEISAARAGPDATVLGIGSLLLDEVLAADWLADAVAGR
jgi:predicted NBD/HSP70 family sugar kinase